MVEESFCFDTVKDLSMVHVPWGVCVKWPIGWYMNNMVLEFPHGVLIKMINISKLWVQVHVINCAFSNGITTNMPVVATNMPVIYYK